MAAIAPAKKTLVFIPSKQEGYVLADIVSQNEREVRIRPRDKGDQQERLVPVTDILPSNPESAAPPDDNTALMHLHAASLLHNLRVRYDKDQIYTYTAYILLAVNPYKTLPIYDDSLMERYRGKSIGKEVPHVFAVTDRAYRLMKAEGINQSIVISGESGAGKTETSKYAMRFLAHVGKASAKGELGERVLDTNPILEAFGNAKTLRNNNSSRFGKYIKINFNKDGSVVGASIVTYLLERSRVTQQDKDERNYHIFYQLCAGANDEERKSLKLGKADQYHMLRQSGCIRIEGVDDAEEFQRVKGAMDRIGIGAGERTDAFRVLAGLLHLSNVTFKEGDKDDCQVENPDELQVAAELFKIDFESFKKTLITRTMETRGQVFEIPLKHFEAVNARNALAKAVYQRLFDWLVARINKGLQEIEASHQYIGILDIFGFEFFQRNSFEQLCINYANEKLQQYFNQQIFKQEQDIYERDGIKFERVKFVDNTDTIDMIEKRPGGILHILEEENRMPNGSDKSFCLKVHEAFKGHSRLAAPAVASRKETGYLTKDEGFLVNHFAGEVTYDVANFLEKNNDTVHGDLLAMFQRSKDPFLQHLFPEQPPPPKFGPKERSTRFSSVGGKFSVQLQELMKDLGQTSSHFIRCIKPNALQRAGNFAGAAVLEQLRASGMLEALRLLHAGYPTRCAFDALYKRYGPFMPEAIRRLDAPHFCEAFLMALEFKETDFQIGLTKVFFRSGKLAELDEVIGTEDQKVPDHIIAKVKKWLVKKRWRRLIGYRKACVRVVRRLRALRALRLFMRMAGVAVVYRRSLWRLLQRVRRTIAARNIQAAFRCARLRFQFVRRRRAAVCIQSHWKGHKTYQLMKPVLTERREARLAELAAQVKAERERQERERREQAERYRKQVMENLRRKEDAAAERKRQEQRTRTEYTKTTEQHVEETVTVTEPMPMTQELFNVVTDMVKQLSKTVADLQEEVRQLREERVAPAERGLAATASKVEAMETHAAEEKMRLDGELAAVRASAAERAERVDAKIADVEEEARRIESESRSAHDQLWHAMGQRAEKAELERSVQSLHGELSAVANKAAEAASSKSDAVKSEMTALNEKIRAEAAAAEKRLAEELDRRVEEAAKKADAAEAGLRSALEAAQAALAKQITDVQEKSIAELRKQLEATEASLGEVKVSAGRAEGAGGEAAAAAEERLGARLAAAEEAAARAESGLRDAVADAMESARAMLQAVSSKQEEALREAEARLQAAVAERAEQAREALSDTERRVADIAAEQEKGLEAVAATASAAERRAGELEQQLREALAEGQSRALAEASAAAAAAQQRVAEVERQLREAMAEQQRAAEGAVAAAAKEAKEAAAAVERQLREALAEQQRAAAAEAAAAGEKGRAAEGALGALEKRLAELKDTQERQRASAVAAEAAVAELRAELHKERARLADMERAVDSARQETSQTREVSLGQQSAALAEAEGRLQAAIAERGAATAALEQRLAESERALREALAAEAKRHEALQEALGRQEKAAAGALEEQRKALEARLAAFAAEQASASASTAAALDKRLASAAEEQQRAAAAAARAGEGLASQLREELRRQEGAVEELKQRVAQLLQASVADEGRASAASEKFEAVEEALKSEMAELRETIARTSTVAKEEVAAAREQLKEDVFAAVLDNHEATVKKDIEALKAQMLKVAEAAKAAKTAEAAKAGEAERRVADMEKAVGDAVKRFSDSSADLRKDFRGDLTEGMAKLKEELEGRLREVQEAAGRAANAGENERRLAQLEDSYQRAIDENQNLRHQLGIARHDDLESSAKLDHLSSSLNTTAYNSTVAINRYQNVVVEQEKLRKELAKERESNEARVAGLVEEISRSNEKIKSFERTAALFEAEKLRNEKLLQETLKRVEEIEKRHELEGTPAKTVRSASVRGIPVPAPSVSMGSVEMEPMGGESGSPPRQLTLLPSPPEDPVTPTPSKRAIEAEPEEMSMTPQRCNEALAPLMKQRGGQVKALADAVSRFVGAIAQPTSIRGSFTQRELPKAENDMLRPELRHLVSSLIDIFGQKAKKRGGMLGFGGEALHAWDVFETFAQNHPMRDQTNPLPTYLVGMVETHVRSVLSNADFIKRSSARDVKDARFHALVRAALNNKTLHAALRELFENMFPTLTPLYEDDAPVLHPSLQHDVVLAVEPLARIPFAYYLDLFNPVLASERDIRASTAR